MATYKLSHLSNEALLHDVVPALTWERGGTAVVLAYLAEIDARRLYRQVSYPSMYEYCVHELELTDDSAYKRIRVARVARQFPDIFPAVADRRLHLSAVVLLAPYLTPETADELLAAAAHKRDREIEQLLAERFPRPDVPTCVKSLHRNWPYGQLKRTPANWPHGQLRHPPRHLG